MDDLDIRLQKLMKREGRQKLLARGRRTIVEARRLCAIGRKMIDKALGPGVDTRED